MASVQDATSGTAWGGLILDDAETARARRFSTTTIIHAQAATVPYGAFH